MTEPNTTLGRYVIQAELGQGGFASFLSHVASGLDGAFKLSAQGFG